MSETKKIQAIIKAIELLNANGYVVKTGRSSSPQLKKTKKK